VVIAIPTNQGVFYDLLWPGSFPVSDPTGCGDLLDAAPAETFFDCYSSLSLVREALSQQTRWRRASLLPARWRCQRGDRRKPPGFYRQPPTDQTCIVLAMDVSGACTTDIEPNRQ
jgi:hypothetical protein